VIDLFAVQLQRLLPHHLLSRLAGGIADCSFRPLKNLLIRSFVQIYGVDLSEAARTFPEEYATFNDFFTRELREGVRPLPEDRKAIASPVDGRISQAGELLSGRWLIQAKGIDYPVEELLADRDWAAAFRGGCFVTLYLSPRDYHRVHMPVPGRLVEMVHVPGRLFGVGPWTVENLPRLFTRNERVIALFETEAGPMALVMVGALIVGSIATVWHGVVTPPSGRSVGRWSYAEGPRFERGAEVGRFRVGGSTVILLFAPDRVSLTRGEGEPVRMGQELGRWR